jgi:hypothetical protein
MNKLGPLIVSLSLIIAAGAIAGVGTLAQLSDSAVTGTHSWSAAVMDIRVGGSDNPTFHWTTTNMEPCTEYFTGFKRVKNVGSVDGNLTVTIRNLMCMENGLFAPEIAAGDSDNVQMDPDGFSQEGGYGELWDQVLFTFIIDMNGDLEHLNPAGWQDKHIGLYPDESGYYSIPVDTPIVLDADFEPGETLDIGIAIHWIDDTNVPYTWILDGVPNNAAMSDTIEMDLEFNLFQT